MRKAVAFVFVAVLLCSATAVTMADYYATKADYRAGKLTEGTPIAPKGGGGGADDCTSPPEITGPLDFNGNGDTTGAASDVDTIPIACNGNYTDVPGPDHIYTFTAAIANQLTFTLTFFNDTATTEIYTTSLCGDGNSCVTSAASDDCFARSSGGNPCGANSDESFGPIVLPAGTYFFNVDSFYAPGNPSGRDVGPYDLLVQGMLPVELIEFSVD
jgi:hypothetical protein